MKTKSDPTKLPPGGGTALLVIDVQQGLFEKSIPIYQAGALLTNLNRLITTAHHTGTPVIFVQHNNDSWLAHGSPGWLLHPELIHTDQDLYLDKTHPSAFEDTNLAELLAMRSASRLVIAGLVTHGCVKATSQDALARGYAVTLAADGHSSFSKDAPRLIQQWNERLASEGAKLVTVAEMPEAEMIEKVFTKEPDGPTGE